MKHSHFAICLMIFAFMATAVATRVGAEPEVCILEEFHASLVFCSGNSCQDPSCQECCDAICVQCHQITTETNTLSEPTVWNPGGVLLDEAYPEATQVLTDTPADACQSCHAKAYGHVGNHQIEMTYDPSNPGLRSNPAGLLLVDDAQGGSRVRCVTCHNVHITNEQLVNKLLRMSNEGSAMCLACHEK